MAPHHHGHGGGHGHGHGHGGHHGGRGGSRGWGPWPYAYPVAVPIEPVCSSANFEPEATAAILRQTVMALPAYGRCPSCGRVSGIAMTRSGVCAEILCMYERRWFPAGLWTGRSGQTAGAELADAGGVGGSILWYVGTAAAVAGGIALYAYLAKPTPRAGRRRSA